MGEPGGDNTPAPSETGQGKESLTIGLDHKNPLLYLQQLIVATFMRTGKPVDKITLEDITQEDIDKAPNM